MMGVEMSKQNLKTQLISEIEKTEKAIKRNQSIALVGFTILFLFALAFKAVVSYTLQPEIISKKISKKINQKAKKSFDKVLYKKLPKAYEQSEKVLASLRPYILDALEKQIKDQLLGYKSIVNEANFKSSDTDKVINHYEVSSDGQALITKHLIINSYLNRPFNQLSEADKHEREKFLSLISGLKLYQDGEIPLDILISYSD